MNHKAEKIMFVICLAISLSLLFLGGIVANNNNFPFVFFVLPSLVFLLLSGILLYESGHGKIPDDDSDKDFALPVNEVYETVGVVQISGADAVNGSYIAILKDRKRKLLAYQLKHNPPKCFKKTSNKTNPYVPYPLV